ncbi:putative reverse transcriptase domain-containing protein, partial [Tanacetum coccineum]
SSDSSLRHSSSGYAILDSPCDSLTAISARLSSKICRPPTSSVPVASPACGALSPIGLGVDVEDSYELYIEPDIDPDVLADIDAYDTTEPVGEDSLELVSIDGSLEVMQRGLDVVIHELYDHMVEIPVHRVRFIKSVQRDQGHMIVTTSYQRPVMSERIGTCRTIPTATCSGMTQDAINELIAKRVEESLQAYDTAKNPRTETEIENGNLNVNNGGVVHVTRECTYQDFVKCQSLNYKGTEGVVGLTRWFEKMETMFHISNCPPSCRVDDAYAMTWKALMKLMTEVEKYIGGLLDNIQGNVIATEPTRLQDAIRVANNLMDQKLKGYAIKNAENKRRFDSNSRDNRQQQQPFKRQNINGQNVARAYTVRNNVKRKGYAGVFPYCNKCRMHHERPYMARCGNCKKVGHMTIDCRTAVTATLQRASVRNQTGNVCYECVRPRHYRSGCPKLRNQNLKNKTGNKTGNNEAKARAYTIGGEEPALIPTSSRFRRHRWYGLVGEIHAMIICDERIVCIPYGDEVLIIEGDGCSGGSKSKLNIISCTKTQKYIQKGCPVYLAQVTAKKSDDKPEEKRLEEVPIVRDFPEVFPEDLPGLPPTRQVNF